jgi:hypothetical protein
LVAQQNSKVVMLPPTDFDSLAGLPLFCGLLLASFGVER